MSNNNNLPDSAVATLERSVAHLERGHDDMKQNLQEVKAGVKEIREILIGNTEAVDKSLVWRVKQNEIAIAAIKKLVWTFALAIIGTLGTAFAGWAVAGFPNPWAYSGTQVQVGNTK